MNDEEYIRALLTAEPDTDFNKRHGEIGRVDQKAIKKYLNIDTEIYLTGEEKILRDGAYLRVATEQGDVYISEDMIIRLARFMGGEVYFD